jgi:hypothetical protein
VLSAEFESVYETQALALSAAKNWCKPFAEGRSSLYDDPRCGRPLTNDLAGAISSMLKERPDLLCKVVCRHFRIVAGLANELLRICSA